MNENKIGKYFKYAIGEVFLVMVGILLALQVNNWNEDRKIEFQENEVLREIYEGLESDLKDVRENYLYQSAALKSQGLISQWRDSESSISDSLNWHFANSVNRSQFLPNTSGFGSLKLMGNFILRNNELKKKIVHLYEYDYSLYKKREETYLKFIEIVIYEFNMKHFLNSDMSNDDKSLYSSFQFPVDMSELRSSTEHGYLISSLEQSNMSLIDLIKLIENKIINIMQLIEDELNKK